MSKPKLISPMLDNFIIGDPIRDCNGVRCCPAMENESNDKYIVKIVSTPASQTQVDALLLSGAYSDKETMLSYFQSIADGITQEAEILQKLSQLEGFVPFKAWQTVPMDADETGFDVYLLSPYTKSLGRQLHRSSMTHLGALNLGLDLCAALAVCRHSGYLYVNLKPENVYIADDNEYRIGDLGFLKLDSLKYASLPERYRSQYTAPEIADAFSALNTTIDIYAVGLILYQAYNDGNLPFTGNVAPNEELPPPPYADYEMSEIILKACSPDPAARWSTPIEMGQALVEYMQRNGANDTPIAPVLPVTATEEPIPEEELEQPQETQNSEEISKEEDVQEVTDSQETEDQISTEETQSAEDSLQAEEESSEELPLSQEDTVDSIYSEDAEGNLSFLNDLSSDDTDPENDAEDIDYTEVTEEVSDILTQADDLISHPIPDPVVQPEAIDVPLPPPITLEEEDEDATEMQEESGEESTEDLTEEVANESSEKNVESKPKKHWIRNTVFIVIALAIIAAGIFFYRNFYLQPIDSILLQDSSDGVLTVLISAKIDEKLLTVQCSDTYGNQLTAPVENGKAVFTGLAPNSAYTIKVHTNSFYRLTGDTSAAYTTPSQTNIVQFRAVTGSEDGSVILSFAIDGPDSNQWKISYKNDKKEKKEMIFSGHMVSLTGLTVGKSYTFTLQPVEQLHITGTNEIKHTASKIIKAEKVQITGCIDNVLTASWSAPEKTAIKNWTVRCYNNSDFDQTIVTEQTTASFEITDATKEYTVEVTAEGMSVNQRAFAAANSATITDFKAKVSDGSKLVLTWKPVGDISSEGWLLLYTIDDGPPKEITCTGKNRITISPVIPGCNYSFTLQTADGKSVLGGMLDKKIPKADNFEGYAVSADTMEFMMCKRPSYSGWNRYSLSDSDYRTEFVVGEKASYLIRMLKEYNTSNDEITCLFVIRNKDGVIISAETTSDIWIDMWYRNYCELDIPTLPETPGEYTLSVFFNGQFANENTFTIVKESKS